MKIRGVPKPKWCDDDGVKRYVAPLVLTSLVVVATVTCYAPTEVTLDITTDLPCGPAVPKGIIYRGSPEQLGPQDDVRTDPAQCTPRGSVSGLGTLVITPSGDRDGRAAVKLVFARNGKDPEACNSDPTNIECITARRSFSFLPHTSRRLPIHLSSDCFGVPCDENLTTCVGGKCVPLDVTCVGENCNVTTDGGVDPPDAPSPLDGGPTEDVVKPPSTCVLASKTVLATGLAAPKQIATTAKHVYWIVDGDGQAHRLDKATGAVENVTVPFNGSIDVLASDGSNAWLAFERGAVAKSSVIVRFEELTSGGRILAQNEKLRALWVFPPDAVQDFYYVQSQGAAGNGNDIHVLKEPSAADSTLVSGVAAPASFVVTNDRMLSLTTIGLNAYFRDGGVAPLLSKVNNISAMEGDGTRAWLTAPNTIFELVGGDFKKLHGLPTNIKRFVFDDAHFYWTDGTPTAFRVPRLAAAANVTTTPEPVFSNASVTRVNYVAVDRSPQGCMYLWTDEVDSAGLVLRVAPKP